MSVSEIKTKTDFYPKRVCPKTKSHQQPIFTNISFNECVMHCQQQEGCSLFDFQPHEKGNRGFCGNFRPQEPLLDTDDNTCTTYETNNNVVAFQNYDVETMNRTIDSVSNVSAQPAATRTFEVLTGDALTACQKACMGPYSECSHFTVDGNKCTLAYGPPPSGAFNFDIELGDFNSNKCRTGNVIDDPNECQQAVASIQQFIPDSILQKYSGGKTEAVDANLFRIKKANQLREDSHEAQWNGVTNNAGAPYGCIVYYDKNQKNKKYHVYFNTNKTNKKNGTNAKVCKYRPRNKYVIGGWNSNQCTRGQKIKDPKICELVGSSAGQFSGYNGEVNQDSVPYGCMVYQDDKYTNPTVWFNTNTKNKTNQSNAPVCDLFPGIHSGDFKPDNEPKPITNQPGISGRFVDVINKYKSKGYSVPDHVFGNPATSTCLNETTVVDTQNTSSLTFEQNGGSVRWQRLKDGINGKGLGNAYKIKEVCDGVSVPYRSNNFPIYGSLAGNGTKACDFGMSQPASKNFEECRMDCAKDDGCRSFAWQHPGKCTTSSQDCTGTFVFSKDPLTRYNYAVQGNLIPKKK